MIEEMQRAAEPWMRGTYMEIDALRRGVVHAIEMAREDVARWAEPLSDEAIEARPDGLPSVGWQLRHLVRSLDRLLTYADGQMLTEAQLAALSLEREPASAAATLAECNTGMASAIERVQIFRPTQYEDPRGVGRQRLPTTVGGLLLHCAEHTQRHAGQLVTTAKLLQIRKVAP